MYIYIYIHVYIYIYIYMYMYVLVVSFTCYHCWLLLIIVDYLWILSTSLDSGWLLLTLFDYFWLLWTSFEHCWLLVAIGAQRGILGRGDDTVGSPHRAQISQCEFFELVLLLKLDKRFPVEQFEATVSQSTVPCPPLITGLQTGSGPGLCLQECHGCRTCCHACLDRHVFLPQVPVPYLI